jgi:DNA-binding transcriptional ArsR family regulator
MPRASLLLGMVVMLAIANAFPGFVWRPSSPEVDPQSQAGIFLAVGDMSCLNCSGLSTSSLVESTSSSQPTSQFLSGNSPIMATTNWIQDDEEDAWMWRGKVRSRWESVGFDSGIFELFMRMKGAKTRLSLLDALCVPKDRMQLAQELGLDWKAIDYHIVRLSRYGLVHEEHAFGKVKLYRLTALGESLLRLVGEFNGEIYKDARIARLDASAPHD